VGERIRLMAVQQMAESNNIAERRDMKVVGDYRWGVVDSGIPNRKTLPMTESRMMPKITKIFRNEKERRITYMYMM
jgi:hypothetical protein